MNSTAFIASLESKLLVGHTWILVHFNFSSLILRTSYSENKVVARWFVPPKRPKAWSILVLLWTTGQAFWALSSSPGNNEVDHMSLSALHAQVSCCKGSIFCSNMSVTIMPPSQVLETQSLVGNVPRAYMLWTIRLQQRDRNPSFGCRKAKSDQSHLKREGKRKLPSCLAFPSSRDQ